VRRVGPAGRAPDGPPDRRLLSRTHRPEAPYHGAVHRLAPLHGVALLFKAAAPLPVRARHASVRAAAGAIEGSRSETQVPAGCTPNRDSLHLPLHLL
jgi:hypothetical protein